MAAAVWVKNKTVTKTPGKTNLLRSIKLESISKNPLTYNSKYSIKEQRSLQIKENQKSKKQQLKNKKWLFIWSTLNITKISLIDRNIQNSNNGDGGSDDFNDNDGDIVNEAGDDKDDYDGETNDDDGGDGGSVNVGDDNDDDGDADDDGGDDKK